ncbi:radical SAM protein [Deltaproteobacteria bacterium TL4]
MKKKLILVNPKNLTGNRTGAHLPPLCLFIIAALTPKHWDVEIIDENHEEFTFRPADLIGFTAYTNNILRAYEIATICRNKGVPTVIGGIHASMLPDEALHYVDTVVTGEAENVWPKLIEDLEQNKIEKLYTGTHADINNLPMPRYDLLHPKDIFAPVQTARGCPFDCEFCSVSTFNGKQYRQRPVDQVIAELEKIPNRKIFFVDDNLIGSSKKSVKHAADLFQKMIERKLEKRWVAQVSMNFGEDEALVKLAHQAGCRTVLIGVESENVEALAEVNKTLNLKIGVSQYEAYFERINKHGINVIGALIFGMDTDTAESLRKRADYAISSNMTIPQITCLTPLPGTRMMEKFVKEGRLIYNNFPADWPRYDFTNLVFKPKTMSEEEFKQVFSECVQRVYSPATLMKKIVKTLITTRSFNRALRCFTSNKLQHSLHLRHKT